MASVAAQHKSVIISFDPQDKRAAGFFEWVKMMDFLKVEDSPYDPQYVAQVKSMNEQDFQPKTAADIWK